MVFACKSPDFSLNKVPQIEDTRYMSLKEYLQHYGDMIMCVGSSLRGGDFENRGIFRNPASTISNDFKLIAMTLHAFSGSVAEKYFAEMKPTSLGIAPIGSMYRQIISALKPDEYTVNGRPPTVTDPNSIPFDAPDFDVRVSIPTKGLDRYYRNHPERNQALLRTKG